MDDIAIDMVELQSSATRFEGRLDPLWTMIGVPQLCGNEQVLSQKRPRREGFLNRLANRRFIAIALRTIEVSKSCFQCGLGRLFGYERIRNERAKPGSGNRPRSVGGNPRITKHIGCCHGLTPSYWRPSPVPLSRASGQLT